MSITSIMYESIGRHESKDVHQCKIEEQKAYIEAEAFRRKNIYRRRKPNVDPVFEFLKTDLGHTFFCSWNSEGETRDRVGIDDHKCKKVYIARG